jgi:SpoVK/Ycf46/Vps4 family AAA+-type ATPase
MDTNTRLNNNDLPKEFLEQYQSIITLWSIRVMYDLKAYTKINVRYDLDEHDQVFKILELSYLVDTYDNKKRLKKKKFRKILQLLSEEIEARAEVSQGALFDNIEQLGKLAGLNDTEKTLLVFGVLLETVHELELCTDILDGISPHVIPHHLAVILGLNRNHVRKALAKDGLLHRTGLLRMDRDDRTNIVYHFELMDEIAGVLLDENRPDIMKSLTRFFLLSGVAKLIPSDYQHISKDYQLLHTYLDAATKKRSKGVNILLYGPPGTGKTEMVKTLAADLKFALYEVTTSIDEDLEQDSRMDSYRLCQQVLKRKTETLVMFDEIEDAFIRDGDMERFGIRTSTNTKKGETNHLLEANPLPTIWVSNVVSHIDEAIIRRFDYVMKLNIPPRKTRARIIKKYTKTLNVSDQWIDQVASNEHLAPALIARATKVVHELNETEQAKIEASMELVLSNTLDAMGHDKSLFDSHSSPITYRLDALNPDYDLVKLQKALSKKPQGRLCLYGPSGTGKSEFARHLAKELDMPLLIKRASDLLDPYIGMTEKYMRDMFEQAKDEKALLLLDEADSFLRDRTRSRQSWEITQVNELLTQMEQFKGLFFCTTNLMEGLDQASLRRFDVKGKFDYLKPEQVWTLFKQTLEDYQDKAATMTKSQQKTWQHKARGMQGITPGDFATVVRQNDFSGEPLSADALFKGLEREVKFKQYGAFKGIGFVSG